MEQIKWNKSNGATAADATSPDETSPDATPPDATVSLEDFLLIK